MNVSLTAELEELVNEKVKSGLYTSASEVIREALRLLKEQDQLRSYRLAELKKEVRKGVAQLDQGQYKTFSSPGEITAHVKAEGRKRLAQQKRAKR
jgi:antitoxin ParD1/3/4